MSDATPLGEQESIQSKSIQSKSLKNDKLGVFAKILEGLIRNPKQTGGAGKGLLVGFQGEGMVEEKVSASEAPKGTGKGKKKVSLSPGEEKTGEGVGALSQKERRNKAGLLDSLALAPQDLNKVPGESAQKEGFASNRVTKEKKGGATLQNLLSKTKKTDSLKADIPVEEAVKGEVKPEALAKGVSKPDTGEIKAGKTGEKEGSRKIAVRDKGEALPVSFNPQRVSGNPEKEGRGASRTGEAKARDKRRERMGIEVRDLRSWEAVQQDTVQGASLGYEVKSGGEHKTAELMVDLSSGSKSREAVFREAENRPVQAFEDILSRELYQNLNGDIVRQAQVILKDGGEGTIRLTLKPESLGNVKIQLEMTENKITGHIIVETNEALRAFEREIHSLEQAFRDSGFAGADLDTALASGNEGSGADQQWRGGETEPFFSERFAASSYDAVSDRAEELVFSGRSDSGLPLVNMLV
jgi:flagellar hook-length control protein FliK